MTLPTISGQTVLAGAPLPLVLSGASSAGNPLEYTVSVTNSQLTNSSVTNPQLVATVPQNNPSLKISVSSPQNSINGDMVFQLFKDLAPDTVTKIQSLAASNFYDGLIFHRVIENFMIQGGDPAGTGSGDPGFQMDDEFNPAMQFTVPGLLAMANSGPDTQGSQFFITAEPTRWLDFDHTIFGILTAGESVRAQIASVPVTVIGDTSPPNNDVIMTDVSTVEDDQTGVLRLSAPHGTTGTATVNVTAKDTVTQETVVRTFQVTVSADSENSEPFLSEIAPVAVTAGATATLQIPATDIEGDSVYYDATVATGGTNLTLNVNHSTGQMSITGASGAAGVYSIEVKVYKSTPTSTTEPDDIQLVPVYVSPAAPTGLTLTSASDTGSSSTDKITNRNNTSGKTLQFTVSGVVSGAMVDLFDSNTLIGSATASGTSVTITTNGTSTLTDGAHTITAKQSLLDRDVDVGNLSTTTDLASEKSSPLSITVETVAPVFTFTPGTTAIVGTAYTTQATTQTDPAGAVTYQLTTSPSGMTINETTGLISWTPASAVPSSQSVVVQATDPAGNSATRQFTLNVLAANTAPVLTPASPALETINEDTTAAISLTGSFINDGTGTTTITDADTGATVGGIALIGITGAGTWRYSTDGSTFQNVAPVNASSALLLAKTAELRYVPVNGETATITYRAWDTNSGTNGGRADLSATTSVGGATAFSSATDTATLTVTSLNDSPVLTAANPSLGSTAKNTAKTIDLLSSFLNNGTGTTTITDSDVGAVVGGIALVGVTGGGNWQYSTDGTTFQAVTPVSTSSALLLPNDARLRYTPTGTGSETATITYRGWDTTSGSEGGRVDLSSTSAVGGVTAYSSTTDTASLAVNEAPVLTSASPSLGTTNEDTAKTIALVGSFINNSTGTTTITDSDTNAVLGGIALVGVTGSGAWTYSTDGATFQSVGTVSASSALLLPKTASLRYTPSSSGETATITYRAWDTTSGTGGGRADLSGTSATGGSTAFSTASDTGTLTVTALNDAPVLTAASPSLGSAAVGTPKTISLADTLINKGTGTTTITDADSGAVLGGIALVGAAGTGTWDYSTDGTTFQSVGTVSTSSGLLLPKDAKLRFTPSGTSGGTPTITYRGWDTTSGTAGSKADTTTNGGTTAFSTATDTASFTVAAANGSIAGFVYIDANNDGLRLAKGKGHLALPGVVVKLLSKDSSGNWTEVSGKSPTMSGSDGSYKFEGLAAGTYQVQEVQPSYYLDGKETAGTISGTSKGTAGADQIELVLGAGENGIEYNFGERGLRPGMITKRLCLASTPSGSQVITNMNAAPVVDLAASTAGSGYSASMSSSGSAVGITATDAAITDTDSSMLKSMKATINGYQNATEKLEATVTDTGITSNYSNGVLTLSGVANRSVYETVLRSLKYSDTSTSRVAGTRTIDVVVNDGVADSHVVTSTVTVPAGSGFSIAASDSQINSTEATSTAFKFTGATVGATYSYSVSSSGGGTAVTGTGTVTAADQQVTGINVSTLSDGTLTYSVTQTNAGQTSTATATATLDRTVPTGYSITADDSQVNSTEATSTKFTFAGAEVGATYNYTVTSSGGGTAVTGTGTITSATQQVTGINVSNLTSGTLTYSVTLTDPAGNAGTARTATATLDRTAPSGYSIAANDSNLSATESTSTGFKFTGAEVGATYSYTVNSSGGGAAVTGTGTVTSATQQVTGINLSTLNEGTVTFSVTLTDAAGNAGTAVTATAALDETTPTGYSITANDAQISGSEVTNAGFTFAGAEVGTTYSYTVSSSGGGNAVTGNGTVTSATQQITGINLTSLSNGTITYSVTLTDSAGNQGAARSATATLSRTGPTGYSITTNDSLISGSEATATGFTFAGAEVGATYNYTVSSSGGGTAITGSGTVTAATQQVTGINVSSLSDGILTYSVTLTNTSGNAGAPTTATAALDRTAPTGYTVTTDNKVISQSELTSASFKFAGAEVGTTYSYIVTSSGGGAAVNGSGTVTTATQQVTGIDVSGLTDGTLTYSVKLTDSAGNQGTAVTTTATLDRSAPTGYSITLSDAALGAADAANTGFTFSGAIVAATYDYSVSSSGGGTAVTGTGTISSATQQITGINVSTLADGTLTYSVTLTSAGHTGEAATATATLDRVAPTGYSITADSSLPIPAENLIAEFTFAGAEVGTTYSYTMTSTGGGTPLTGSGSVASATQSLDIAVSALQDGNLTVSVKLVDAVGNMGTEVTAGTVLDRVAPSGYSITANDSVINTAELSNAGFTLAAAEIDTSYLYTISSSGGGTPVTGYSTVTTANQQVTGINIAALQDGSVTYSVQLVDKSGNEGPLVTATATLDRTAAAQAALQAAATDEAMSEEEDWLLN